MYFHNPYRGDSTLTYQILYLEFLRDMFNLRKKEDLVEFRRAVTGLEIVLSGRRDDLYLKRLREINSDEAELKEKGISSSDREVWFFDEKAKLLTELIQRCISEQVKAREFIYDSEIAKKIGNELNKDRGQNLIITGSTGSGKSYTAIAIAQQLSGITGAKFDIKKHVCFSPEQFIETYNDEKLTPPGSIIIFDEIGVSFGSRDALTHANKTFAKLLQIIRHRAVCVIFTTPDLSFLDSQGRKMMHYWFKTEQLDRNKGWCILTPYMIKIDQNKGKMLTIFPKMGYNSIDKLYVHKIEDEDSKVYEKLAKTFKDDVAEKAATSLSEKPVDDPKYETFKLYKAQGLLVKEIVVKMNVSGKTVARYNKRFQEEEFYRTKNKILQSKSGEAGK